MVAKVMNPWIFDGKKFAVNDLIEISKALFNHLFETSIVALPEHAGAAKIFEALITARAITPEVIQTIGLTDTGEKWTFKLKEKIDGIDKDFYYTVHKDPDCQKLDEIRRD